MKIQTSKFNQVEERAIKTACDAFGLDKIEKIYVVSQKRSIRGGEDSYTSLRLHIQFQANAELSENFYDVMDHLFPTNEENGYLIAAYEYNPYDIGTKEEVRIWPA